ncbi:hypothetical protein MFU01_09380 [Myxococcus fulvus]|uniref:Uncharacterized protein n=1 Tax=Myxococcus fulvus TaxID=33 RepID=A0A511SVI9_MYXFU|nr:hypothetical protein MFU01_09380 [Myxococcus fulvus]
MDAVGGRVRGERADAEGVHDQARSPHGAFQYWLYRKSKATPVLRSESAGRPRATFRPVEVIASPAPRVRKGLLLEVTLPRGLLLRFPKGTQAEYLAHLVAVLD